MNENKTKSQDTQSNKLNREKNQFLMWLSLVFLMVKKELKIRYKGSIFGYMWSMLNPLLYMLILAFVFSHIMRFKTENYTLFILSGILCWNLFLQGLILSTSSIVNNASLLKKVKVSETIFTASAVGSCLINFLLALIPFIIISLLQTGTIPSTIMAIPILLVPYSIFVFGIGLILASLNVIFRDVAHMLEPLLNMVFYATPIIYPSDIVPEKYRQLLELNPIAVFVSAIRSVMYENSLPTWQQSTKILVLALISLCSGIVVYKRTRTQFIYHI